MRWLILTGAALASPALAQPAPPLQQFYCSSEAHGSGGEGVAVRLTVGADGKTAAAEAVWSPPQAMTQARAALDQPDLSFAITYKQPGAAGLGATAESIATVQVFSPIREQVSPAKLHARLNGLTLEASMASGPAIALPLLGDNFPLPGTAQQSAVLDLPQPLPAVVELRLLNKQHKSVTTTRFALSGAATRDALFQQAWQQAQTAAQHPASCAQQDD